MSKFVNVLLDGSQKRSLKPLSNNEFSTQNTVKVSKRDLKMLNYIKFFVYTSTLFFCSFGFGQCPSGSIGVTGAGCGCLSGCNLTAFGGPNCSPAVGGNCAAGYVPMQVDIIVPDGCTFTVEATMRTRPGCSASGADGNCQTCDVVKVDIPGGPKSFQQGASNATLNDDYTLVGPGTIRVSGRANRADEIITYQVSSSDCPDCTSTLPIELLEFNAKRNDRYVDLTWQTASETNNNYFTVEKSIDGLNFSSIGNLSGAGNSSSVLSYKLIDSSPTQDRISYYRLKQTDYDGTFTYSDIVSVKPNVKKEIIGYYNSYGQKVAHDAKGILIIRYSDGTTQKVYQ